MSDYPTIEVSKLKPYAKNSKEHPKEKIQKLANSMKAFNVISPIIIWGDDNEIVAGHARVEAAKLLGLKKLPFIKVDHLSDMERRAYVIADNKLAEGSKWNQELLMSELKGLAEADFDFTPTGFDLEFLADGILDDNEPHTPPREEDEGERVDPEIIGDDDRKIEGAKEYGADEFDEFTHACPRCGFEFDKGIGVTKEIKEEYAEDGAMESN